MLTIKPVLLVKGTCAAGGALARGVGVSRGPWKRGVNQKALEALSAQLHNMQIDIGKDVPATADRLLEHLNLDCTSQLHLGNQHMAQMTGWHYCMQSMQFSALKNSISKNNGLFCMQAAMTRSRLHSCNGAASPVTCWILQLRTKACPQVTAYLAGLVMVVYNLILVVQRVLYVHKVSSGMHHLDLQMPSLMPFLAASAVTQRTATYCLLTASAV